MMIALLQTHYEYAGKKDKEKKEKNDKLHNPKKSSK